MRWQGARGVAGAAMLAGGLSIALVALAQGQQGGGGQQAPQPPDDIATLVSRLELQKYKDTIKGLTQFGDRRQGTKRNRDAVDWIEAQLKSYGCTNTERIIYQYPAPNPNAGQGGGQRAGQGGGRGAGQQAGARGGGQQAGARGGQQGRGRGPTLGPLAEPRRNREGGSSQYGNLARTGVFNPDTSTTPPANLDPRLYELNKEPTTPGERQEVFCTKIGTTHPEEMYIIGGHMDGHGWGEAANDDGSGTALVMEIARVMHMPGVTTERSIRFALWNNEETGLNGARAYVEQRAALQGKEDPPGSGKYPEPKWLGMIQHDMMMWDHGMPRADGSYNPEQRPEADVNVEWQSTSKFAEDAMKLALFFKLSGDKYTTDYPVTMGPHMTNTDSTPFMDLVPALSMRENERGMHTGAGWNPTWHQPIDVFTTYSDKDFKLGLNAAQTTLSAIAQLTGAKIAK